jgi:hypothetical protein
MSEPTWWEEASPAWLFRAKPTDFANSGGICPGLLFVPGLMALLLFHIALLGFPIAILITVGWHPGVLWMTLPVLLLWAVLIPADIKFRRQGATVADVLSLDQCFINWFGFVFWSIVLPVAAIIAVFSLVWWVVSLFI